MSMSSVSPCNVMLVERNSTGGMSSTGFKNRLDAVLSIIDNGGVGDRAAPYYGSNEHKTALDAIEKQIAATRNNMKKTESKDETFDESGI